MLQLLGVSMGVNLVGWAAASYLKTEKFYDLVMINMIAIITMILVTTCGGYVYFIICDLQFGSGTFLIVSLLSHSRSSGTLRQRIATGVLKNSGILIIATNSFTRPSMRLGRKAWLFPCGESDEGWLGILSFSAFSF